MNKWMSARLVALWTLTGALAAVAAERSLPEELEAGQDVTVITSEKLTFDYGKNYAVFEENVVVSDPGIAAE